MESKDKKISFFSKYKKLLLPIIVVAIGFMGMKTLVMTKAAPFKMPKKQSGVLVETLTARHGEHQVLIEGNGTVQAAKEIALTPQVSGKVTYLAPAFKAGGFFKKGELLFRIESEDYKLAVDKARATVARAKVELATVEGQARIARLEWERLKEHVDEEPNPLVLHEPQLNNARANVDSAKAALRRAELDHERTKIFAPFKCRVRSESIDIGQFIRSGETVGVIAGTEEVEIIVALPFENLYWIKIPRMGKKNNGSIAIVSLKVGDKLHSWEGRVIRSFGELDPQGRLSRIAIGIKDPYNLKAKDIERPSMEIGMFVEVTIHGKVLSDVVALPRNMLREDSTVWSVGSDNKLTIKKVEVMRKEREKVVISGGVEEGEVLVKTNITGAANGMLLRLIEQEEKHD